MWPSLGRENPNRSIEFCRHRVSSGKKMGKRGREKGLGQGRKGGKKG